MWSATDEAHVCSTARADYKYNVHVHTCIHIPSILLVYMRSSFHVRYEIHVFMPGIHIHIHVLSTLLVYMRSSFHVRYEIFMPGIHSCQWCKTTNSTWILLSETPKTTQHNSTHTPIFSQSCTCSRGNIQSEYHTVWVIGHYSLLLASENLISKCNLHNVEILNIVYIHVHVHVHPNTIYTCIHTACVNLGAREAQG